MPKKWFLLQFKPNSYALANHNLTQQGFETFLPMQETSSRKHSRFISSSKPIFPGYMFVAFDHTHEQWRKINSTFGVNRLVTFNNKLKEVPKKLIYELMDRCDSSGNLLPLELFKKGDQVKLLNGPFANFIANIETLENDQRIWILTDLMGRKTKVKTSPDNLQHVN